MLYHYTDRLSGADIMKEGRIRATAITLHKDMYGRDRGFKTPPLVWLSTDACMERTVMLKMIYHGWPASLATDIWRFVLPEDYSPLGLEEYADHAKINIEWFEWTVKSATLGGADFDAWRLHPRHIPAADWLRVEVLTKWQDEVSQWAPLSVQK